jgi:hypothetical protein
LTDVAPNAQARDAAAAIRRNTALDMISQSVDKLTRPYQTHLTQRPPGGGRREVAVNHDPLIIMLARAVTAKSAESGSATNGSVLNAVAHQKLRDLTAEVNGSWLAIIPSAGAFLPAWRVQLTDLLYLWRSTFLQHYETGLVPDRLLMLEARRYSGWVNLIELMFNPPSMSTFTGPCPQCQQRWYTPEGNPDEITRVDAIAIDYNRAVAVCRSCGEAWSGMTEFAYLAGGKLPNGSVRDTPPLSA